MCYAWQFTRFFLYQCLQLMAPSISQLPVMDGFVYHCSLRSGGRHGLGGVSASTLQCLAESQSQEFCSPSCVYATKAWGVFGF